MSMNGELHLGTYSPTLDVRASGLGHAAERWGRLAYGSALAFLVTLYANPAFYWPVFEQARLGVLTAAVCAFAVVMRRITSGEPLRFGGMPAALLFAYAATIPLSYAWTISPDRTLDAIADIAKLLVVYVAIVNSLDTPGRLRTFLLVGALVTLAPSLGGIQRWLDDDRLIEGYRTAWRGNYADPNRLAMGVVLLLPAAVISALQARRAWLKGLLWFTVFANVAVIVLTHSRSGAIAMAAALALTLLRGRQLGRGLIGAAVALALFVAVAPESFWRRNSTIADYQEDASFQGREHAWSMLKVIASERPLGGVGAGAFIESWTRFAPLSAGGDHLIAHNIFMEIQGEQGALALLSFGLFAAWLFVRLWAAGRDPVGGSEARAILAGAVAFLICELVNGYSRNFNLYVAFAVATAAVAQAGVRAKLAAASAAP
jgi:putative inorganic carbon (hco3(-)) transporter